MATIKGEVIMDYKEKYEMALEGIQEILGSGEDSIKMSRLQLRLQGIFPELKESDESEDEEIRNYLINFVKINEGINLPPDDAKKALVWLEKQGNHSDFLSKIQVGDKVTRNEDGVLVNLSQLNRVAKPAEKQDKQKSIDNLTQQEAMDVAVAKCFNEGEQKPDTDFSDLRTWKYIVDAVWTQKEGIGQYLDSPFTEEVAKKLQKRFGNIEQKPAWSEEDENNLHYWLDNNKSIGNDKYKWLKSLKDRVQPKQEWSEEDIKMIDWLIRCCEKEHEELCNDKYGHQDIVSDLKRDCRKKWDWLESLKNRVAPQKQWKPSEEQMKALLSKLPVIKGGGDKVQDILESLYQDLKKLREE